MPRGRNSRCPSRSHGQKLEKGRRRRPRGGPCCHEARSQGFIAADATANSGWRQKGRGAVWRPNASDGPTRSRRGGVERSAAGRRGCEWWTQAKKVFGTRWRRESDWRLAAAPVGSSRPRGFNRAWAEWLEAGGQEENDPTSMLLAQAVVQQS